ncbi:aldehyde dehydrogenase family protein [Haliea sp. E1-2-M8]|uniref:aldehyde dehydrogenase family protein n=1 Tax=Haliea sp. E1-2-M8 TaxID=3064706 RepID=UPI002716267D|nr:aldehyde dehydrogenase family protein [Haliea sp. E1-2-M8]MDO8863833.1 aldehyde dehydrogenase family protein [Haliea sp. E1-2-M8]
MRSDLFINGEWVSSDSDERISVVNPATGSEFHSVPAASVIDIDRAVTAAREAHKAWAEIGGKRRARYLHDMASQIGARREELARLEVADNGKPLAEAFDDMDEAARCFTYYAEHARALENKQFEILDWPHKEFRCRIRYEPMGVVAGIIPWNYPFLMAVWKVAPALAAGCTIVLKPSEITPLTALELGAMAREVALPPGVLNIVTGTGQGAGAPLAGHLGIDKIAFTGSVETGRKIMSAASRDVKNIGLELGGKSALLVFDDCDFENAIEWILFGIFWNKGEICSATSRVLIHRAIYRRVVDRLVEEADKLVIGNGLEDGVQIGPLVSEQQYKKVSSAISKGKAEGAMLLTSEQLPAHLPGGYFLRPAIFEEVDFSSDLWREEIFGPVLCVAPFDTEEEAIQIANDSEYGLAASVMSRDKERCDRVAISLQAGTVWLNCSQPNFVEAPWGGVKRSGIGRELGRWGLEGYLEVKQVTDFDTRERWGWFLG